MKITIIIKLILLFVFSNSSYGQSYTFDKIVKSTYSHTHSPNEIQNNLFNSKDYSYHMQIYSQNDSLKSTIYDYKNKQNHFFYLVKSDSLELYYLHTFSYKEKPNEPEEPNEYRYEFSDLKTVQNKKEISFTTFKKNKKIGNYKLEIQESSENFFPVFSNTTLELFNNIEITPPLNFTVISSVVYIRGNKSKYELNSIENMHLEIQLPENIILSIENK